MSHPAGDSAETEQPLGRMLERLLERASGALPERADELDSLGRSLSEPLIVAVAGHTNAGKSTLVNALIGHHVAPTAATECTRVITWYRFGPQQPELVAKNGARQTIRLIDDPITNHRHLPETLPVPPEEVDRLEVALMFEQLRPVTIIDTPGLSGEQELATQTEALLASGAADMLLFVLNGERALETEDAVIADFRRRTRPRYAFPANAFGVLSRADTYAGPEPMAAARAAADRLATQFGRQLAGVLPVMGRIAETVETGSFAQQHTDALHLIAALPTDQRQAMLLSRNLFLDSAAVDQTALPRAQRQALIDRLSLFGIRALTEPGYAANSTDALYAAMYDMSGLQTLRSRFEALFVRPRLVHKATAALTAVAKMAKTADIDIDVRDSVLDDVERLRGSDAMHVLAELRSLAALYSGAVTFGQDPIAAAAATRLFEAGTAMDRLGCTTTDLSSLRTTATEEIGYWQTLSNASLDAMSREVAATAVRSVSILLHTLKEQP